MGGNNGIGDGDSDGEGIRGLSNGDGGLEGEGVGEGTREEFGEPPCLVCTEPGRREPDDEASRGSAVVGS